MCGAGANSFTATRPQIPELNGMGSGEAYHSHMLKAYRREFKRSLQILDGMTSYVADLYKGAQCRSSEVNPHASIWRNSVGRLCVEFTLNSFAVYGAQPEISSFSTVFCSF